MNATRTSCALWVAVGLIAAVLSGEARGSVVYDNSKHYLGRYHAVTNEFGDEISLARTARLVSEFMFEYYGDFIPQGDETVRLRFYVNDGPGKYLKPKTLLYDTGPIPISTNFNSMDLSIPNVQVPDTFTWTVQFGGLSQTTGDEAGLLFYDPPTVGAPLAAGHIGSYYDYWKKVGTFWTLYNFGTNPPANFGARVYANSEVLKLFTVVDENSGKRKLNWSGKYGSIYLVQSSLDLKTWSTLGTARPSQNGQGNFAYPPSDQQPLRFYRVVRLAAPSEGVGLAPTHASGNPPHDFAWQGNPSVLYDIQISEDGKTWQTISTVRASDDGKVVYTDADATHKPSSYYRAARVDGATERPTLQVAPRQGNDGVRLLWQGNPGFVYPVESTTDLVTWDFLGIAKAGQDGAVEFCPQTTPSDGMRFYRLVLP